MAFLGYVNEEEFSQIKISFDKDSIPNINNIDTTYDYSPTGLNEMCYELLNKKKLIIEVLRFEIEEYRSNFTLTGFGNRFSRYFVSISTILNFNLSKKILVELNDKISKFDKNRLKENSLFIYKYRILGKRNLIQFLSENLKKEIGYFLYWNLFKEELVKIYYDESAMTFLLNEKKISKSYFEFYNKKINIKEKYFIRNIKIDLSLDWSIDNKYFEEMNDYKLDDSIFNYLKNQTLRFIKN